MHYKKTGGPGTVFRALLLLGAALVMSALGAAPACASEPGGPAIEWSGYDAGLKKAAKDGRFVIVDFYTTWCRDCKKMDKKTLSEPEVVKKVKEKFVAVKVDGEKQKEISSRYGVFAYPMYYILDPAGKVVCQKVGYVEKDEFLRVLDYAASGAYKEKSYPDFVKSGR